MSEEEKEAIDELKKEYRLAKNCDYLTTEIRNRYARAILDYIDKLQKENEHRKEVLINTLKENEQLSFDIDDKIKIIDKLQKENKELKEDNSHQWEERCRLTFELERLQEENEKINKVADKMYEYISYYGWEDFESNTGCNREEMVDYFYKE